MGWLPRKSRARTTCSWMGACRVCSDLSEQCNGGVFPPRGWEALRPARGPSCGRTAVTVSSPRQNSSLKLNATARSTLPSVACALSTLLLVTPACGHRLCRHPGGAATPRGARTSPCLLLLHLAPLWTPKLPSRSRDHPSRDRCDRGHGAVPKVRRSLPR